MKTHQIYQIVVEGRLDESWVVWFEGLNMQVKPDGSTALTGSISDQSALRGILQKIWDLNLKLVSLNRVD